MHRTPVPPVSALPSEGALSRRRFLRAAAGTAGGLLGAGLLLSTRARAGDEDDDDDRRIRTTAGFVDFATQMMVLPGSTTLTRTEEGVSIRVHASDLTPGNVYTFWMVEIESDGFAHGGRVAGRVLGRSGIVNLSVEAEVGEILGDFHPPGIPPLQAAPLADPLHSQFRLVIRNHGPASRDRARLYLQLHTYQPELPPAADYAVSIHHPPT